MFDSIQAHRHVHLYSFANHAVLFQGTLPRVDDERYMTLQNTIDKDRIILAGINWCSVFSIPAWNKSIVGARPLKWFAVFGAAQAFRPSVPVL